MPTDGPSSVCGVLVQGSRNFVCHGRQSGHIGSQLSRRLDRPDRSSGLRNRMGFLDRHDGVYALTDYVIRFDLLGQ